MLKILLLIFLTANTAFALNIQENVKVEGYEPVEVLPEDKALSWSGFKETKQVKVSTVDEEGYDLEYLVPQYSDYIKSYAGKTVRLKGFMFPLEGGEKQANFLFGPYPLSCAFHYHVNPNQVVTVSTGKKNKITFSYDPIVIEGTLKLPEKHDITQIFYTLEDAIVIN